MIPPDNDASKAELSEEETAVVSLINNHHHRIIMHYSSRMNLIPIDVKFCHLLACEILCLDHRDSSAWRLSTTLLLPQYSQTPYQTSSPSTPSSVTPFVGTLHQSSYSSIHTPIRPALAPSSLLYPIPHSSFATVFLSSRHWWTSNPRRRIIRC
jgi:hypothetical protein